MDINNQKLTKKDFENAYAWIKEQDHYPTRGELYDKYGFLYGQIIDWYLSVKLSWIIHGMSDNGTTLIPVKADNPKLKKLLEESVILDSKV